MDTLHWQKGFKSAFLRKNGKSNSFLLNIYYVYIDEFLHFSGLRQKQKEDQVDFGNDQEDNIIEDLNTLSALYDKIESNVETLRQ